MVLRSAAETRRGYCRAVAARAIEEFMNQSQASAETPSQLSRRLGESGAVNKLDQARSQVFDAELLAQLATARRRAVSEREHLIRDMGLWGNDLTFRLPNALTPLPARPRAWPTVEIEAVSRRVDLQSARIEVEALAKSYGLTGATRFLNLLDVSGVSKTVREPGFDRFTERGVAVELQVPLLDFGAVRVRKPKRPTCRPSTSWPPRPSTSVRRRVRPTRITARPTTSPVTTNARSCRCARSSRTRCFFRYNAMQIDVFALLAEARQSIASTVAAIAAEQDFRLAEINLQAAVVGGGRTTATVTTASTSMGRQSVDEQ